MGFTTKINDAVARSFIGKYFQLEGSSHARPRQNARFLTELRAGLATFFAMAYIISTNAGILTDSGGSCICNGGADDPICLANVEYDACQATLRRDFITGTAAISALTSFCMGLFSNLPVSLAPGMGINAYFAYTVVGFHGSGPVPYKLALTAVFIEGFVFIALTLLGMRQWLARIVPASIKIASGVGIGLFLTIIGMYGSAGIGVITGAQATPLELGGCYDYQLDEDGLCPSGVKMRSGKMWIGIFCGGFLTAILLAYRVKGAILAGIILVSIISWPRGDSPVTYFPHTATGDSNFDFFKKVVAFHPIEKVLNVNQWNLGGAGGQFAIALFTFLYVDILDCTGTLYSMARYSGQVDPKTGDFEGSTMAFLVDASGISIGSLFGLSPVTAFIESGAGIAEGGKTGLTAMVTGVCFFISIFFAPIFASIPPWATGCTLIIIGSMMASAVKDINWKYFGDALPAFITLATMPFTYSIAYGLIAGIITYIMINGTIGLIALITKGRVVPPMYELKEPWTWKISLSPPSWLGRAIKGYVLATSRSLLRISDALVRASGWGTPRVSDPDVDLYELPPQYSRARQ
ncbi:permease family-domain-containing protein [Bisporella sp. PMI_857]|nr:permease family-domain-containing protein [Bisporella sp. PMI_857]